MRTCLFMLVLVLSGSIVAQEEAPPDTSTLPEHADTVLYEPGEELEGYIEVDSPYDSEQNLTQNPTLALFKSMLIPGWGQIGNRAWFKAGLFATIEGVLIASALNYRSKASDLYDRYQAAEDVDERNRLYDRYEDRVNKRNRYTWFTVITIFISMFDAYVDAHLSGFPVEEPGRLGLEVGPTQQFDLAWGLSLSF
ncbi:hypothetical protein GF377_09515 [candidate division GN15 bacterium]|nr:hypothetical protein [candidate division GN15 bacterium]